MCSPTHCTNTITVIGRIKTRAHDCRKYKFKLNVGEDIWTVRFDDWMFLQADGVLLNKATAYRWGINPLPPDTRKALVGSGRAG